MVEGERRAKRIQVSGELLDQMFTCKPRLDARFLGIVSDAPEDMHVVGIAGYDALNDNWTFVCESKQFDPLLEGEEPPLFSPQFTSHFAEAAA